MIEVADLVMPTCTNCSGPIELVWSSWEDEGSWFDCRACGCEWNDHGQNLRGPIKPGPST